MKIEDIAHFSLLESIVVLDLYCAWWVGELRICYFPYGDMRILRCDMYVHTCRYITYSLQLLQ